MNRAAIYTRVSTHKQEAENQLMQLRDFVARHQGWELVEEYHDTESGGNGARSAFTRLFEDAHRRRFDVVVFWALDRFSREGTRATIHYLDQLEASGVHFVSYTERYLDSTGLFRDALIGILAALAKQERVRLSDRVKAGMERARSQGKHLGRPATPPRQRQRVAELAAAGLSPSEIVERTGVSRSTVWRLLRAH